MFSLIKTYFQELKSRKENLAQKYMKCPKCYGGLIMAHTIWGTGYDPCNYCSKTGYVLREEYRHTCDKCSGKGYIDPQNTIRLR